MDSEAVKAGAFWMTPVRQDSYLDDLEGLVVLLLTDKKRTITKHLSTMMFVSLTG